MSTESMASARPLIKYRANEKHALLLLLIISIGVNIALAHRLDRFRTPVRPRPFDIASPLEVTDSGGKTSTLTYDSTLPTVLYWFSPTCGWCEKNFQNFESLANQANGRYRFVPVSSAPPAKLAEYASRHGITTTLYSISVSSARSYGFRGTPTSTIVSPRGKLVRSWSGAYVPVTFKEIQRALLVRLAGAVILPKRP